MSNMITKFAEKLASRLNEYKAANGLTYFKEFQVSVEYGNKFAKVFRSEVYANGVTASSKEIVAFVNIATGDIFKPATYKAPAKHARGNVNSPDNGMEAIAPQGHVVYLRG